MLERKIQEQVELFKKGFPDVELVRPAKTNDGILKLSEEEIRSAIGEYDQAIVSTQKFVPASGAATRMFKDLIELRNNGISNEQTQEFFNGLPKFPFDVTAVGTNEILAEIFDDKEFHRMPKGLFPFHKYPSHVRTAAEEHLTEAIQYLKGDESFRIHFTVSPEHVKLFEEKLAKTISFFKESFDPSFSTQDVQTDTVAVDSDNNPFRDENGELIYRPAGHGALLTNLNTCETDIVFIKNIDNVVPERVLSDTVKYKRALAGILLSYQAKAFDLLNREKLGENIISDGRELLRTMGAPETPDDEIITKLNRPMRVCGMVRNTGEPGGGPFWVRKNGKVSLQIVEGAQVNSNDSRQADVFNSSTHFNPVDLVCGICDFQGNKFDLLKFRDNEMGFITEKSFEGKTIKALELPGLWNGSMANWNTIFVEVPISTFNPVKRVTDLLRPEHQP